MSLREISARWVYATLLLATLSLPTVAHAQVEDPGLEPAPSPTTPPPTSTPPPPRPITPPPAPRTRETPPPVVVGPPPPALAPVNEAPVEDVKETVTYEPIAASDDEWEKNHAAPTVSGPIGLFHMMTAEVGAPLNFRVGVHMQGFSQDCFLISQSAMTAGCNGGKAGGGDSNSRFLGDLTLGLTGPDVTFLRNLELYLAVFNSSNQNTRVDTGRTDPEVILALGDVGAGLKGAWEVARGLNIGANVGVRFYNSISGVAANFDATNATFDVLGTFDLRKYVPSAPLRVHVNLGYYLDNSLNLLPAGQCAASTGVDACIRSRVVETFAYGLGVSRVRFSIGAEVPVRPHTSWGIFGVAPFAEYHLEDVVGDGDAVVANALTQAGITTDRINGTLVQYLTAGIRLRPVAGLVVDAGVDFGLGSPGFRYGPPMPQWNIIFGASYVYDTTTAKTKVVTRTVTRTYPAPARAVEGKVRGIVRSARTKKPLVGAVVKFPGSRLTPLSTADDGSFISCGLPPGPVRVEVTMEDYEPATINATVENGAETAVEAILKPLPPKESKVHVKVTDEKGTAIQSATIRFNGNGQTRETTASPDGSYDVLLPPGEWTAAVEAPGFLAKEHQLTVVVNQDQGFEVQLRKRPVASHVTVTKDQIVIKGVIHFGTNNAVILPDGQQLLDEVADVLAKSPQLRKIAIEGHTDNRGLPERNMKLSADRANAVRDYLVKQGIAPERLTAEGFGATKPLVPNLTAANRAKNRRVEFRIVDQDGGVGAMPRE